MIGHYNDKETQQLATEVRQELSLDRDRLAYLELLAAWVRDDLYPAAVAAATAAGTAPPSAPPTPRSSRRS